MKKPIRFVAGDIDLFDLPKGAEIKVCKAKIDAFNQIFGGQKYVCTDSQKRPVTLARGTILLGSNDAEDLKNVLQNKGFSISPLSC